MDVWTLISFLGTAMLLTLIPGPDNMFVLAQSIVQGKRAGFATTLGLCTGLIVHITAATLGISVFIYQSALAFNLVKYAGAAYLLYLAWRSFRVQSGATWSGDHRVPHYTLTALYRRGILMNVLNPKVSLFFLALLPPFIHREAGHVPVQMLVLGTIFLLQALLLFGLISLFADRVRGLMLRSPLISHHMNRIQGVIFAVIGLKVALSSR
ncbi:LysE family translocator [Paenibacillus campi]|uniref:LysE family translocator n=1 Tax=Paenibacillus campi TaxID=3106031 RepID=UPI002AFED6F7|nr:LysE family translocator [Paenibacillus sp. SGZ-1014]